MSSPEFAILEKELSLIDHYELGAHEEEPIDVQIYFYSDKDRHGYLNAFYVRFTYDWRVWRVETVQEALMIIDLIRAEFMINNDLEHRNTRSAAGSHCRL